MELINLLTEKLGLDESQARGGAGLLLSKAKDALDGGSFDQIKSAIPEAESLIGDAPDAEAEGSGGLMGMVGSAASKFGLGGVADIADISAGFDKLGIPTDKLGDFATIVLDFIESKGGAGARQMVEKFLKP